MSGPGWLRDAGQAATAARAAQHDARTVTARDTQPDGPAPPQGPTEHAIAAAAGAWHHARAAEAEARRELSRLMADHDAVRGIGLARLAALTGISRNTLLRWASPEYDRRQGRR